MFIDQVPIQSLGNTTYVVGSEQSGQCAVIDPVRDIDHYTAIAAHRGVRSPTLWKPMSTTTSFPAPGS